MTVPGALDVIRELARRCGEEEVVGAGTMLDAETARACLLPGAGVFVAKHPVALAVTADAPEDGEGPFELLRARSAIEGETTALAAREATRAEVSRIHAAVEALATCEPGRGEAEEGAALRSSRGRAEEPS